MHAPVIRTHKQALKFAGGEDSAYFEFDTCTDGHQNGEETDVDCGGQCGECAIGGKCKADSDCPGVPCAGGLCGAESCKQMYDVCTFLFLFEGTWVRSFPCNAT